MTKKSSSKKGAEENKNETVSDEQTEEKDGELLLTLAGSVGEGAQYS